MAARKDAAQRAINEQGRCLAQAVVEAFRPFAAELLYCTSAFGTMAFEYALKDALRAIVDPDALDAEAAVAPAAEPPADA